MHSLLNNEPAPLEEGGLGDTVELTWALLRRRDIVILFCTMLGAAIGVIHLLITLPKYSAQRDKGIFSNNDLYAPMDPAGLKARRTC